MKRLGKYIFLLILSTSVYFIYNLTKNNSYTITSIGDTFSQGITSFKSKEYSYIDYYKEELQKTKKEVNINNKYSKSNQTLYEVITRIKETSEIRRTLYDSDILIINLGYNDLLYALSIEEDITNDKLMNIMNNINRDYQELIKEIKKYYHNKIIVVGYPTINMNNKIRRIGIKLLNESLKNNEDIIYIDTENLLKNERKYYDNPHSSYPNNKAYQEIGKEIIAKTLEK